jgi:hypothetical protein
MDNSRPLITALVVMTATVVHASPPGSPAAVVREIMTADYEADLTRLLSLYEELAVPATPRRVAARVRYWRGFARWRRAINGVNDGAPVPQMIEDLQTAEREFDAALAIEPDFVDAKAGQLSAIGIQLFLTRDRAAMAPLIARVTPLAKEAASITHDNPRMIWVLGQARWRTPPDWSREQVLERQGQVIAEYQRGLDILRTRKVPEGDGLDPRWGEPELLMNLAWSNLNKAVPDVPAAERYAREALTLVPNWHYVRDILLPQIIAAKR